MGNNVQRATDSITGFGQRYKTFRRKMEVLQYASGTMECYSNKIAVICLYYNKLAEELSEEDVEMYLQTLYNQTEKPTKSQFEHTVYGLRCYYKLLGIDKSLGSIKLPRIRKAQKLPVVLSQEEVSRLLRNGGSLRNKTILSLLYSAGMRVGELQHLEISDIDYDRKMIHIRQGKGRKDRYVPLARAQSKMLRAYVSKYHPHRFLFYGTRESKEITSHEVRDILRFACQSCGIIKKVCCHTLRHSYATHLLEMGENIYRISDLLGHSDIQTTLIYLHLVQESPPVAFSPLDRLFPDRQPS